MTAHRYSDVAIGKVVVPSPRARASARSTTRDRIIDAAVELTMHEGWAGVTMAKLASRSHVSRQTVYNEVGTKAELAEAMILREVERFLQCVTRAFEAYPSDLLHAIREASYAVLERAQGNLLLHAIVGATHGADNELLPLLTSRSQGLLGVACGLVRENVETFDHGLTDRELEVVIDAVVRVVLSQVMQPSSSPSECADAIGWITGRLLPR